MRFLVGVAVAVAVLAASGCEECVTGAALACSCPGMGMATTGRAFCGEDGQFGACDCTGGGFCGDTVCNTSLETPASCPGDCGFCGDGLCAGGETAGTCPGDCGPGPACGDGFCAFDESPFTCPMDCPRECGDGICTPPEDAPTCPIDCRMGGECGDGICDMSETRSTCPTDCRRSCDFTPSGVEIPLSDALHEASAPAIAADGGQFWASWIQTDAMPHTFVVLSSLDGAGTTTTTRILADGTPRDGLALAAANGFVATAWVDVAGNVVLTITQGAMIDVLPPAPIANGVRGGVALALEAFVVHVAWSAADGVHLARFSTDGVRTGPDVIVPADSVTTPAVVPVSGADAIAWIDRRPALAGIHVAVIEPAGTVRTSGVPVASSARESSPPALVWTGTGLIAAWEATGAVEYNLVSLDGSTLGPARTLVTTGSDHLPALAWLEGPGVLEAVVAWSGSFAGPAEDVMLGRIDRSGIISSSLFGLVAADDRQVAPRLAWDGENIGVVWLDRRDGFGAVWFTSAQLCL